MRPPPPPQQQKQKQKQNEEQHDEAMLGNQQHFAAPQRLGSVRPIRTLSKGTLESIVADVQRRPRAPPKDPTVSEYAECCSSVERAEAFMLSSAGNGDSDFNAREQPLSGEALMRNNSFDVPKLVQEALKFNAFLPVKDVEEAKLAKEFASEELRRIKSAFHDLKSTHSMLQQQKTLVERKIEESQSYTKQAELAALSASLNYKAMQVLNEGSGSGSPLLLTMDCVHNILDPLKERNTFQQQFSILQPPPQPPPKQNQQHVNVPQAPPQLPERKGSITMLGPMPIERMRSFQVGASAIEDEIARLQKEIVPSAGKTTAKSNALAALPKKNTTDIKAKLAVPMKRSAANEEKRSCTNCGRVNTPQWRIGPKGPKSLCNACGVHYRKFKELPKFSVNFSAIRSAQEAAAAQTASANAAQKQKA